MLEKKHSIMTTAAFLVGLMAVTVGTAVIFQAIFFNKPKAQANTAQPLSNAEFQILSNKLVQVMNESSLESSFNYLRQQVADDRSVARDCHPLLHHLGRTAYEKYGDFKSALAKQDELCNSGYTHGVIEAYFEQTKDIDSALRTTCADDKLSKLQEWQCYHGIGHGVMYYTQKDLNKSLRLCTQLTTDFARNSCHSGVFMERFVVINHMGRVSSNSKDITIDLCQTLPKKHKSNCYVYAPTAYLQRHSGDYSGALDECFGKAESSFFGSCMYGVGSQAVKDNVTEPNTAVIVCQDLQQTYRDSCISGAVGLLLNHYGMSAPVETLCWSVFARFESVCTKMVNYWKKDFA